MPTWVNDNVGLAALLVAIFALPFTWWVAWWVAKRERPKPQLRYAHDFDVLVNPSDGLFTAGLTMGFRGGLITRLSRTYIAFWNGHGGTVIRSDIVEGDALRIAFSPGDAPLQTRVVAFSREAIDFRVRIDADMVVFDFDFLDAGDGAIIEVVHRGATPPEIVGTVRGADMRGRGTAALTRPAIEWMASQGRIRRIIGPLGFSTTRRRKRSLLDLGVLVSRTASSLVKRRTALLTSMDAKYRAP